MRTDEIIRSSFAEMLQVKPYDKIRIQDICGQAHLSRSTFSKWFRDKEDVVRSQMHADFVMPVKQLHELLPSSYADKPPVKLMLERFYQSFYDRRVYYEAIAKSAGPLWVAERIAREMRNLNAELWAGLVIDEVERSFVCGMFSYAHAMTLVWWIEEDMQTTPLRVAEMTETWLYAHWREKWPDTFSLPISQTPSPWSTGSSPQRGPSRRAAATTA